jgi:hypothetical protein
MRASVHRRLIGTALALLACASAAAPSGVVSPYDPTALPKVRGGAPADARWPVWRKAMKPWQWAHIEGTDLASAVPDPAVPGSLRARINAWNGIAADAGTGQLYSADNGGHADYAGNEVYAIDLMSERPRWKVLRAPTPPADILKSDYTRKIYNDYYRDGRPASTHTYYALQFLPSRHAIFLFGRGSMWGTGNEASWKTDAFSLAQNDWQPAGTWPDVDESRRNVPAASICKNPDTDDVYVAAPAGIVRFDPKSGKFDAISRWLDNATAVSTRPCAVDTRRDRIVYFGDAYHRPDGGLTCDIKRGLLSRIRFEGPSAEEVAKGKSNYAWYDADSDRFLLKTGDAGKVFAIDAETFVATPLDTAGGDRVPDAMNGVQNRWQRLPVLGGYAYYPRAGSGIWFLATR